MRSARCPSCGASVEFRSSASVMAVCGFCRTTLVRRDLEIEKLGRMADLAEDASPFSLGYTSHWRGVGFRMIGRLQLKYASGFWNEWFCQFDDGREGWISEGSGLTYVTFERTVGTQLPALADFSVGMTATLDGEKFTVTNIEHATCIASAGELPFLVASGYDAPAVDLRSGSRFASLDFSENPPRVYLGVSEELSTLTQQALSLAPATHKKAQIIAFKCKSCGAPLHTSLSAIKAVACEACGAIVDAQDPAHDILSKAAIKLAITPALNIGATGKLRGVEYAILGFMRRQIMVDLIPYQWDEYLLHSEKEGFRWLSCYHNHWNLGRATTGMPQDRGTFNGKRRIAYLGKTYTHFSSGIAEVVYVAGEFNWQVCIGEQWNVDDYIAPPLMLSCEQNDSEMTWTLSEYLSTEQVANAFKPKSALGMPTTPGANQPSPYAADTARYWLLYTALLIMALAIHAVFSVSADKRAIFNQHFELAPNEQHQSYASEPFDIPGHRGVVVAMAQANVSNRWIGIDLTLTNTATGQHYLLEREIGYYFGQDEDGIWSEGSQNDKARITDVPPGRYILETEVESDARHPDTIAGSIALVRNPPAWSLFWLTALLLLIVPAAMQWRASRFEIRRWEDSDHPVHFTSDDSE